MSKTVPSSSEISMHDVLPPHWTVCGPGVGTEPRQPQILTRIAAPNLLPPEDRDDADELFGIGEEWERRHRELTLDPVSARDPVLLVCRPPLVERDPRRALLQRNQHVVLGPRGEARRELVERHLAGLGERAPEDLLGRLVVEDELAVGVGDERGRGEIRRELTREDEDQVFLTCSGNA
jgi:hypothetical protein